MSCITSFTLQQKDNSVGWKGGEKNVSLCDSRGCIPLEVQIKRYLLAGRKLEEIRAKNTFEDYDEAFKDVPIITQDMDITEILEIERQTKERLAQLAALNHEEEEQAENTVSETQEEKPDENVSEE